MTLLDVIKIRTGIPEAVTVYDDGELAKLAEDAIEEMLTAGVPEGMLPEGISTDVDEEEISPRVINTIVLYIQAHRGQDRSDTDKYIKFYREKLHKLMLEPDEEG